MLTAADREGFTHIVSWHNDGLSFRVHNQEAFVNEVLPEYFPSSKRKMSVDGNDGGSGNNNTAAVIKSKIRSFQRQCNLYGFKRVTAVKPFWDACYYHPKFYRDCGDCCKAIDRPLRRATSAPSSLKAQATKKK